MYQPRIQANRPSTLPTQSLLTQHQLDLRKPPHQWLKMSCAQRLDAPASAIQHGTTTVRKSLLLISANYSSHATSPSMLPIIPRRTCSSRSGFPMPRSLTDAPSPGRVLTMKWYTQKPRLEQPSQDSMQQVRAMAGRTLRRHLF